MTGHPGLELIRQAAAMLEAGRPPERRLLDALRTLLGGSLGYRAWPEEAQRRADEVHRLMFRGGSLEEAARTADDASVRQLSQQVRDLEAALDAGPVFCRNQRGARPARPRRA